MARTIWGKFGGQQTQPASSSSKPVPIPVLSSADAKKFGLENFGNTCYANSVIQALYFCGPFRDLVLQSTDSSLSPSSSDALASQPLPPLVPVRRKPERKGSTSGSITDTTPAAGQTSVAPIPSSPTTLFSALRSLFLYISTHPADTGTVAPRAFIDKLKEVNDVFRSNMHQDAHEFLNYLLNKIVEEIEEERKITLNGTALGEDLSNSIATLSTQGPPTTVTGAGSSNSGTSSQAATLVHKLFEGVLTSETRCLTCETVSQRDESFLDLSIDIEQNSSVTACLRQFSASEMLCQKNKFFCDSCCDLQEAEKRMKIKKLPNLLALHLKRFKYQEDLGRYIKLAYRVAFPFQLRLFNTVDDTDDADRLYNLFGIVVHIGNGPHHGHYISIIKSMGTWLVFDDTNVSAIAESDIPKYFGDSNSGSAYVLYYQAADIDLPALGLRIPEPAEPQVPVDPPPASPQPTPVLPPGLVEEGDSSDLSDPSYPITPLQSSPLLSFVDRDKPSRPEVKISMDDSAVPGSATASPALSTVTPTPTATKPKGGLFSTIRRAPSVSAKGQTTSIGGPESRKSFAERSPNLGPSAGVPAPSEDDAAAKVSQPPPSPSPTPVVHVNGKERESPRKEPERKSSTWFGKRKSFKLGERRAGSEAGPNDALLPMSPQAEDSSFQSQTASSSSNSSAPTWFRSSSQAQKDKKSRRPSEPNFFDAGAYQTPSAQRPKSTGHNLTVKPERSQRVNGYESPSPGSASSSLGSTTNIHTFPAPASPSAALMEFPPPRKSSLTPSDPSLSRSPDHKKSLSNLLGPKDKKRGSASQSLPPRPSTASEATSESSFVHVRSLPPVPPLPASVIPLHSPVKEAANPDVPPEGYQQNDKGKTKVNGLESDDHLVTTPAIHASPGLGSFAGANGSATSSTSYPPSSNIKRATRKLSMTAPMLGLGFGKKDKEKKEREREKEGGKGPPWF